MRDILAGEIADEWESPEPDFSDFSHRAYWLGLEHRR